MSKPTRKRSDVRRWMVLVAALALLFRSTALEVRTGGPHPGATARLGPIRAGVLWRPAWHSWAAYSLDDPRLGRSWWVVRNVCLWAGLEIGGGPW